VAGARQDLPRSASDHPCFNSSAKDRWGRIHLPVAPGCNIQCNYCNRRYDCVNESRPGVTSRILEPGDVIAHLGVLLRSWPDISVVGIAGPGDALCDPERTLETIRAVRRTWPGLLLCLSTNGLNLSGHIDELIDAGATHITVTVNAVDPSVAERIYAWVRLNGVVYRGREAAGLLLDRQQNALFRLRSKNITVKVNTVVLPGINDDHVGAIAAKVAGFGVEMMNCLPVLPVADTPFAELAMPSPAVMKDIRDIASRYVPQMSHCRRCRADAAGLL
jgi:nitrogen fixation protein NifB